MLFRSPREDRGDPIRVGSSVDVPAYNASGQVLELRGDDLVVQLGVMKVGVKRRDVRLKQDAKVSAPKTRGPRFTGTAPTAALKELQLRGMGVEEAVEELRTAILEAHALKETPLRVVHGKGQGVLRRQHCGHLLAMTVGQRGQGRDGSAELDRQRLQLSLELNDVKPRMEIGRAHV